MMEHTYFKQDEHPALRVLKFLGFVILGAIAAAVFALVFGYLIMLLWNWLMPTIFGLTTITFWQAVGIAFLARLIFGGGKHSSNHSKHSKYSKYNKFRHYKNQEYKDAFKNVDWRHFGDYWVKEGKQSYNDFIEREKNEE